MAAWIHFDDLSATEYDLLGTGGFGFDLGTAPDNELEPIR
jgi:hypothetical protein